MAKNHSLVLSFRISEIKEKKENVQEEIRNLDIDLEEHQGIYFLYWYHII